MQAAPLPTTFNGTPVRLDVDFAQLSHLGLAHYDAWPVIYVPWVQLGADDLHTENAAQLELHRLVQLRPHWPSHRPAALLANALTGAGHPSLASDVLATAGDEADALLAQLYGVSSRVVVETRAAQMRLAWHESLYDVGALLRRATAVVQPQLVASSWLALLRAMDPDEDVADGLTVVPMEAQWRDAYARYRRQSPDARVMDASLVVFVALRNDDMQGYVVLRPRHTPVSPSGAAGYNVLQIEALHYNQEGTACPRLLRRTLRFVQRTQALLGFASLWATPDDDARRLLLRLPGARLDDARTARQWLGRAARYATAALLGRWDIAERDFYHADAPRTLSALVPRLDDYVARFGREDAVALERTRSLWRDDQAHQHAQWESLLDDAERGSEAEYSTTADGEDWSLPTTFVPLTPAPDPDAVLAPLAPYVPLQPGDAAPPLELGEAELELTALLQRRQRALWREGLAELRDSRAALEVRLQQVV